MDLGALFGSNLRSPYHAPGAMMGGEGRSEWQNLPSTPIWPGLNLTRGKTRTVIHDTEGSAHAESAEDGAAYDARRTDGTSTHYFHDNTSTVQCVRTEDVAYAALWNGNHKGIQHELCAQASFSKSKWMDPNYGLPMLQRAARQVARDCKKWNIPAKKITSTQVANGTKGICGHVDITYAFPQDNGDHTDPGTNFPWADFIAMVQSELEEDLVTTQAEFNKFMDGWAQTSSGKAALYGMALADKIGDDAVPGRDVQDVLKDLASQRALGRFKTGVEVTNAAYPADAPLVQVFGLPARMTALEAAVAEIKAAVVVPPVTKSK